MTTQRVSPPGDDVLDTGQVGSVCGYGLETGTAAELRLALTITLTLTDTGFAVRTLLLGYMRRSPDPNARTQAALS